MDRAVLAAWVGGILVGGSFAHLLHWVIDRRERRIVTALIPGGKTGTGAAAPQVSDPGDA